MKKLFKMALVAVLALSLVACTSSTDEPAPTGSTATTGETSSVKIGSKLHMKVSENSLQKLV